MSDPQYRHTQIGWVTIAVMVVVGAAISFGMTSTGLGVGALIVSAALFLLLLLFGTLTVVVDSEEVRLHFGIGAIRRRFPLKDIRAYSIVTSPWYYGWGIRYFPGGVLYNVSGLSSVELALGQGKRIRIGTDEPEELRKALVIAVGEPKPLSTAEVQVQRTVARRALLVIAVLLLSLPAGVGALVYFQGRPAEVRVGPQGVSVRNLFYSEDISCTDITSLTLEPGLPRILLRTNGYAFGPTLRGHFRVETLGSGQIFAEMDRPPLLLVRTRDRFLVLGDKDPAQTQTWFSHLSAACEGKR